MAKKTRGSSGKAEPAYKVYTAAHDEVVIAEELCDAEELTRCWVVVAVY